MKIIHDISEFINEVEGIKRDGEIAEIIYDYFEGDLNKPVRLIGFSSESMKNDYEIYEEGFMHYKNLLKTFRKNMKI